MLNKEITKGKKILAIIAVFAVVFSTYAPAIIALADEVENNSESVPVEAVRNLNEDISKDTSSLPQIDTGSVFTPTATESGSEDFVETSTPVSDTDNGSNSLSTDNTINDVIIPVNDPLETNGDVLSGAMLTSVICNVYQHSCLSPDSMSDNTSENVVKGWDTYSLQDFFNQNGINLNVTTDQKQYQRWTNSSAVVHIKLELLNKKDTALGHVFGYFKNGDISTFTPVFKFGATVAGFDSSSIPSFSEGQSVSLDISNFNNISFAIKTSDGNTFTTLNSLNENSNDHAVVYDVADNTYLIGFEDLFLASSDSDYNDEVVKLTVAGCDSSSTNTAPIISIIGSNPINLTVGYTFTDPGATATDTEDGDLTNKIVVTGTVDTSVVGTTTLIYSVTDSGGLSASTTRTVVVTKAKKDLTCKLNPDNGWYGVYYNYSSTTNGMNLPSSEWNNSYGAPLASGSASSQWYTDQYARYSQIDSSLVFGNNFFPFDDDPEELTNGHDYHFGARWSAIVTASTTGQYNFTLTSDDDAWVYVNGVLVVDNSGVHSAKTISSSITLLGGSNLVEVFFAERHTSNSYMSFKFTNGNLVIKPYSPCRYENTAPKISLLGDNPTYITVGYTFVDPGATATDTEDGDLTNKIVVTGTVDTSVVGTTTLIYSVTDSGGLSASTTRTVVVTPKQKENTAPVITLIGDNPMNLFVGDTFTDPGATATDTEDGDLTSKIISTSTVDTSAIGTYTVTYSVTDSGGLSASTIRNVVVSEKNVPPPSNTAPIISLIGDNPINITNGNTFTDPGATATDTEDGDLTNKIVVTGTVNTSVDGTYTLIYSVTDSGGLSASVNRTVIVSSSSGGGGGHSGSRHHSTGEVLGATTCNYLIDYLKIDWQNDPTEVLKLQSFLNVFEGESLSYTGVFDEATFAAVERFQNKYKDDILTPWGHTAPTGFVYILTKKKVNEIYCNTVYSLTADQQNEINQFKNSTGNSSLNGSSLDNNSSSETTIGQSNGSSNSGFGSYSSIKDKSNNVLDNSIVQLKDKNKASSSNGYLKNLAVSLFSTSPNISGNIKYPVIILVLLVIIFTVYKLFASKKISKDGTELPDEEIIIENDEENSDIILSDEVDGAKK